MNFIEAIKKLQEDYKLTRKLWLDEQFIYIDDYGDYLDEKTNEYSFYNEDFLADDWEVTGGDKFIKFVGVVYTFEEALKAFKGGKQIKRKNSHYIHTLEGCIFQCVDILANDWEIL